MYCQNESWFSFWSSVPLCMISERHEAVINKLNLKLQWMKEEVHVQTVIWLNNVRIWDSADHSDWLIRFKTPHPLEIIKAASRTSQRNRKPDQLSNMWCVYSWRCCFQKFLFLKLECRKLLQLINKHSQDMMEGEKVKHEEQTESDSWGPNMKSGSSAARQVQAHPYSSPPFIQTQSHLTNALFRRQEAKQHRCLVSRKKGS